VVQLLLLEKGPARCCLHFGEVMRTDGLGMLLVFFTFFRKSVGKKRTSSLVFKGFCWLTFWMEWMEVWPSCVHLYLFSLIACFVLPLRAKTVSTYATSDAATPVISVLLKEQKVVTVECETETLNFNGFIKE
jgi:hypothetical protein